MESRGVVRAGVINIGQKVTKPIKKKVEGATKDLR